MIPARFSFLDTAPCPQWLKNALAEIRRDVEEVPGAKSNPRILEYRNLAHTPFAGDDGAVPWCAIGTNAMIEMSGHRGTRSAMARSYTSNSRYERLTKPSLGCITVLSSSRGPTSGHVGFYVGETGTHFYLAGGNQDDEWGIDPFNKTKLVGHYWPKSAAKLPAPWSAPLKLAATGLSKTAVRDA